MKLFIKDLEEQKNKLQDLIQPNTLIIGSNYDNKYLSQTLEELESTCSECEMELVDTENGCINCYQLSN